ncbi:MULTISPECIES: hypothetical protein [unclassified Streptomyces]|uniref:hypothetical protein n=1 Tax=unclassified Streptomyces TaxID=2593676 RepID=UPI00202E6101|nr:MULTISPECIES: hypothetical protein [unclassified Streptomyces]MCM1975837.1 hypothetical protein [Streptomyces sp. G1]MCX5295466.1 hypothetical protein [Streptomyces sp. NBC_00193]
MSDQTPAEAEFEQAWADERYTRAVLPAVDVNRIMGERYLAAEPVALDRAGIWDMEVRKAGNPGAFIPYVIKEGSASAWVPGRTGVELGAEFVRQSQQRLWLEPDAYGLVLEETYLNHEKQVVTFLGRETFADVQGVPLRADDRQPLFHVQHGVAGTDEQPLNTWRIVLLTDQPDDRLVKVFERMAGDPWLPEFVELYVQDVLGIALTRRDDV